MNMPDIKKTSRGIHLWTEDVIKFRTNFPHYVGGVTAYIRDKFHQDMARFSLSKLDQRRLADSMTYAYNKRKERNLSRKNGGKGDLLSKIAARHTGESVIEIPKSVRSAVKFVATPKTARGKKAKSTAKAKK